EIESRMSGLASRPLIWATLGRVREYGRLWAAGIGEPGLGGGSELEPVLEEIARKDTRSVPQLEPESSPEDNSLPWRKTWRPDRAQVNIATLLAICRKAPRDPAVLQKVIQAMRWARIPMSEITRILNESKIPTPTGKTWSENGISDFIKRYQDSL